MNTELHYITQQSTSTSNIHMNVNDFKIMFSSYEYYKMSDIITIYNCLSDFNLKYFDIAKDKLVSKFDAISGFTQNTITELRDTIWAMNKNEITLEDLQIRIVNFIEKAKVATYGITFEFSIDKKCPNNLKFSSVEGMNIYRIIQETLNNSIKHSGCSSIKIQIYIANNTLIIEISDNGKGFLLNDITEGNGLSNCRKRAQELGAEIDFITLEKGSLVKLSLNHFNS